MGRPGVLVFFMLVCSGAYAQQANPLKGNGKITGKIVESVTLAALEYATITVLDQYTGKTLTGTTADKSGQFIIRGMDSGSYKIVVEFIGYRPFVISLLQVRKNEVKDLKNILLTADQKNLQAVTVTAHAKLVENRIDKLIFNAERDLTSQGGVATDLLKKIPQVSVDVDGNVQLAGNSGIRFLINGKPSTAFGSNMADVLQSIPASQIKSIEIITSPGARYDAQGMGGIINIILKQTTIKGINGNISLTAGTRNENGAFNFNARNKNFGLNAFISGNARLAVETPYTGQRNSTDTAKKNREVLMQEGDTRIKKQGIESGIGVDWTYKKYHHFSASANYNAFGNSISGLIRQSQENSDYSGHVFYRLLSLNRTDNTKRSHNTDASFNYKRTFDRDDQQLEFSVNTSHEQATARFANERQSLLSDSVYYGVSNINPGKESEMQIALDYTQPFLGKAIFAIGLKTTFLDISSDAAVSGYNPDKKQYLFDNSLSNSLTYHQKVHAVYAEVTFPVASLFDLKLGSRYERTEINATYSNAGQNVHTPGYNTFVPAVFFSKKLGDDQVIKLSYSKRIERPDYEDLNPFINTSDPQNIAAGNPYLLPELGQRVELAYSKEIGSSGSFMVTAFYRHNSQDIQPYVKFFPSLVVGDSTYYNVSVSTRENIGTENNTGFNLFADLHLGAQLSFRTNISLFHRNIINSIDVGSCRASFNYKLNLNTTYQFNSLLAAEFFGNFNSARNEVQGKYPSLTTYSVAIRKQFWNKKASLALTAVNPFNEYVTQKLQLSGPDFSTTSLRKIPFRSVGLNFTWKFGLLEFKKEEEKKIDINNITP